MKITISGEHSLRSLIQCIYEQLLEIEQCYAINHARRVTIYMTTTDGCGNTLYCRKSSGEEVMTMQCDGPYPAAADDLEL